MRTLAIVLFGTFGCFLIAAFQKNPTSSEVLFQQAIQQKLVKHALLTNGGHDLQSVQITLTNLGSSSLTVRIPKGTVFVPNEPGEQDLLLVEDELIVLAPKEKKNLIVDAFCMESSNSSPEKGSKMTFRQLSANEPLKKLCEYINGKKNAPNDIQSAVWAVSDNHPIEYLNRENPSANRLRETVCKITGRENTWYSRDANRVMNEQRIVETSSTVVEGRISVDLKSKAAIHTQVKDSAGQLKFTTRKIDFDRPGNWGYGFKLSVTNWEKGHYTVVVFQDGREIKTFPFDV